MSAKPKTSLSPSLNAKVSPATLRAGRARAAARSDSDSASPLQSVQSPVEKTPRTVPTKKPATPGRSPNASTTPTDKKTTRILKPSELQSQLDVALESLKDAKEKLVSVEKEKEKVVQELRQTERLVEEGNEKLREVAGAQKQAEENVEIEKFRSVEMEQASIEAAQKKEEEWLRELESVSNQHAVDAEALLAATQELQKVRQELGIADDAKNEALRHAEEEAKIAEANLEKAEALSAELENVKAMLEHRDDHEKNENSKLVAELKLQVESLKQELEKAQNLEVKLAEKDGAIEQLKADLEAARMAESHAREFEKESKWEVEFLRQELEKARILEVKLSEKDAALEQLNADLVAAANSETELKVEVESLKQELEKVKDLEVKLAEKDVAMDKLKADLEAAKMAESHALELQTELESLKQELGKEKNLEVKLTEKDADLEAARMEVQSLRQELEVARDLEVKLVEKDMALEKLNAELEAARMSEFHALEFETESKLEVEALREELQKARNLEVKLAEKEAALEQLNVDLESARIAESYARNLVDELNARSEELASQAEHAKRLEVSASESMEAVMKQLERSNDLLHSSEVENAGLREEVGLLGIASKRHKIDLEEVERRAEMAKQEASEMARKVELLSAELEALKEEKIQYLDNEKLAASSVQTLLEEKNKLIDELECSRDEEEKSKKALESLASALHEVSAEARDTKEKLISIQVENDNYESQIEDLKLVLKATNEKYENLLGEAKREISELTNSIEHSKHAQWEEQELLLVNALKKSDEDKRSMESEVSRVVNLLKMAEEEASATRKEESQWRSSLKEAEKEISYLREVIGEAKAESMKYKECLLDKDSELQHILQENDELRRKECDSQKKIEDLSKLLEAKLHENGEVTDSEKDYDVLPKALVFSEQNGAATEKSPEVDSNGKLKHREDDSDSAEVDLKTWESCKIEGKDTGHESVEDEVDSKAEDADSYDQVTELSPKDSIGTGSPSEQLSGGGHKKKKALFRKFGSMLKKKSPVSQK